MLKQSSWLPQWRSQVNKDKHDLNPKGWRAAWHLTELCLISELSCTTSAENFDLQHSCRHKHQIQ